MAIAHDDIKELQDAFDERYVRQNDCNDRHEKVNARISSEDKKLAVVDSRLKTIEKIVWIIATATITQVIISIFQLFAGR